MSRSSSPRGYVDGSARRRKPVPIASHSRSASAQRRSAVEVPPQPSLQDIWSGYNQDGLMSPLMPPPVLGGGRPKSRSSSADWGSRPGTPGSSSSRPGTPTLVVTPVVSRPGSPGAPADKKDSKRGWFGGGAGKLRKDSRIEERRPVAWVAGHPEHLPYDTEALVNARPMQDVWDYTEGNCLVHLFPRTSDKGPSFRINSAIFASSPVLTRLAYDELYRNNAERTSGDGRRMPLDAIANNMTLEDRGTGSFLEPVETHLYLPIKLNSDSHIPSGPSGTSPNSKNDDPDPGLEDLQTLIDVRNFFAFLCGQALVATEKRSSFFSIFMSISAILRTYEFSNADGSTYGDVASASFDTYVEELGLADVRASREKTIEGVVLGERMKSALLYNEAFTHFAGKHDDIVAMKSPKYSAMSPVTENRLYRAAMDLDKRTASIRLILEGFEFPMLFSGIAASKSSQQWKEGVRFEPWKEAFLGMRKNVLAMLKHKYGDWPPKAKSKKNNLETSGLNRLVLQDLYLDMCSLYDSLVDRSSLTSRTVDGRDLAGDREIPHIRALRVLLSEYDRSSPPVKPPVPFDVPILPTQPDTKFAFSITGDKKKDIKNGLRKLKDGEVDRALRQACNEDAVATPFVAMFREMENRAAQNCTISEMVDLRIGQWIFMYVVIQALPLLACDAPAVKWTQGAEYFLCEPPRSGVPWANPHSAASRNSSAAAGANISRTLYSVDNGGGVVSLPSDVLVHSVEGIYRRSHCWTMAERWSAANPPLNTALHEHEAQTASAMSLPTGRDSPALSDSASAPSLLSPASFHQPSAGRSNYRHSSLGLGLEALPVQTGEGGSTLGSGPRARSPAIDPTRPRSFHQVDKGKTFDAILGNTAADPKSAKKGRKK